MPPAVLVDAREITDRHCIALYDAWYMVQMNLLQDLRPGLTIPDLV